MPEPDSERRVLLAGGTYHRSWFVPRLALALLPGFHTDHLSGAAWVMALREAERIADDYAEPSAPIPPEAP